MTRALVTAAALASLLAAGCEREGSPPPASTAPAAPTAGSTVAARVGDPEKGRQVYQAQCTACHHSDPSRDGPLGPAVKGSSPELLAARVVHASYPPGYRPKRDSRVMPPRPDLAPAVPDLAAYLR